MSPTIILASSILRLHMDAKYFLLPLITLSIVSQRDLSVLLSCSHRLSVWLLMQLETAALNGESTQMFGHHTDIPVSGLKLI